MKNSKNSSRNLSFDFFRLFFCFTIFFNHCYFFKSTEFGAWFFESFLHNCRYGVTFFFMLSAFCLFKSRSSSFYKQIKISDIFSFIKKRLLRIYPLYFFSNFAVAVYLFDFKDLLLSASLLQVFFLDKWGILNSAGWFVCVLFFLYVISPFFIKFVGTITNKILILLIFLCVFFIYFQDYCIYKGSELGFYSEDKRKLYAYIYPFYWISIFLLGMLFSRLSPLLIRFFKTSKQCTYLEIITIVFCLFIVTAQNHP